MKRIILPVWILLIVCGCGGAPVAQKNNIQMLLQQGKCEEILVSDAGNETKEMHNAAIALCMLVQKPTENSAIEAVKRLVATADQTPPSVVASTMLELAAGIPEVAQPDFNPLLLETALGAGGQGRFSSPDVADESGSKLSQDLAIAILTYIATWLENPNAPAETGSLIDIWNGCYSLLGGSMATQTAYQSWNLFISLSHISLALWEPVDPPDFSVVLMQSTIGAIERNAGISVAAKCDLGSPYDKLRTELSKNIELAGRLERAVSGATACTRGRYAPTEE